MENSMQAHGPKLPSRNWHGCMGSILPFALDITVIPTPSNGVYNFPLTTTTIKPLVLIKLGKARQKPKQDPPTMGTKKGTVNISNSNISYNCYK